MRSPIEGEQLHEAIGPMFHDHSDPGGINHIDVQRGLHSGRKLGQLELLPQLLQHADIGPCAVPGIVTRRS